MSLVLSYRDEFILFEVNSMIITLPDGKTLEMASGSTVLDVAKAIGDRLAKAALVGKVNDKLVDLSTVLTEDCNVQILTYKDEEAQGVYRHTTAHVLAQAVKNIYPAAQLAIGPTTNVGFYYDFDLPCQIAMEDLAAIGHEMEEIIKADLPINRTVVKRAQATAQMRGFNEVYKMQLISELPRGSEITLYKQGNFVDLCRGPHLPSTGKIKFFKLISLAGAYWKGDEKNKMLTRIYGVAFDTKAELEDYLKRLEEAKNRDHNKLGRDLKLFMTDEKVGQGLPLFMPKGTKILQILQRFIEDEEERRGYLLTKTPFMAKSDLYKMSGHWDHYRDKMFVIGDELMDDEVLALRPMTCPFQYSMYKNGIKSYKDLPIRYSETSTLFRNEASGEMHGLIRIRQFTLADGHIICTPEQLASEFKNSVDLIFYVLDTLGLRDGVSFRFSKWDPKDTDKYINEPEKWKHAEDLMKQILDDLNIEYSVGVGEAAFYGPKLDFQMRNVYGKEDTLFTVQVDLFLSKNFDLFYIDENGERKNPYIVHRSSIGCYERTLALLIEKYGGAFPLWLSPEQIRILPITDRAHDMAKKLQDTMQNSGLRVKVDDRNEKIGYKIREAQLEKIPYMLVIGDKEVEQNVVSVRHRTGDLGTMTFDKFLADVVMENATRAIK